MKFWTALQFPLCQAALVDDGKIVKTIPSKPPGTPARRVGLVSRFDDSLIIGRRNSIELWDSEGNELIKSVYHPWIYSLHDCLQVGSELLLACPTLDVVFKLDWEGQATWNWWAYRDDLAAEPHFIHRDGWPMLQLTQNIQHDTAYLNSIHLQDDQTVLATLLNRQQVVKLDLNDPVPRSQLVQSLEDADPHDFQYHNGHAVYGTRDAIVINGKRFTHYSYPKRIVPLSEDRYLLTHEQGVTLINSRGMWLSHWPLPRPFGIACFSN